MTIQSYLTNAMKAPSETAPVMVVLGQARSRYGNRPEPQIELRSADGANARVVNAALYRLAADIELNTPASEDWSVVLAHTPDGNPRVYLQLAEGTVDEAARAMALLEKLVG